jgi:hypothetical protein
VTQPLSRQRAFCDSGGLGGLLIVLAAVAAVAVVVLAVSNLLHLRRKRRNAGLNAEHLLIVNRTSYYALCAEPSVKRLDYAIRVWAIPLY